MDAPNGPTSQRSPPGSAHRIQDWSLEQRVHAQRGHSRLTTLGTAILYWNCCVEVMSCPAEKDGKVSITTWSSMPARRRVKAPSPNGGLVDTHAQFGVMGSVGWSVLGVEYQYRGCQDPGGVSAIYAKLRIPIAMIYRGLSGP